MYNKIKLYGETQAVLAYQACVTAITDLRELAGDIGDVDFAMQQSLYYASKRRDQSALREEFELRTRHGFDAEWLDAGSVKDRYGIIAPCAILTHLAAHIDPYRLASKLLLRLVERGGRVFDRTLIDTIEPADDSVALRTPEGMRIHCKHAVLAAGYATQKWLKQSVAKNRSSYAFILNSNIKRSTCGFQCA